MRGWIGPFSALLASLVVLVSLAGRLPAAGDRAADVHIWSAEDDPARASAVEDRFADASTHEDFDQDDGELTAACGPLPVAAPLRAVDRASTKDRPLFTDRPPGYPPAVA